MGKRKRSSSKPSTTAEETGDTVPNQVLQTVSCPYLGTIQRHLLDFDSEKICHSTLLRKNVHCCLVCGIYLHGRSEGTEAMKHAYAEDHHVFINVHNGRIICLPEGYEVTDRSLSDLKDSLFPVFSKADIAALGTASNSERSIATAINGTTYIPGFVALNTLGDTSYVTCTLHALMKIRPIRDFLLSRDIRIEGERVPYSDIALLSSFIELLHKNYSSRNFKPQISPQGIVNVVSELSGGLFGPILDKKLPDQAAFFAWITRRLGHEFKQFFGEDIVRKCFEGRVAITTIQSKQGKTTTKRVPFTYLTLDLPEDPLFKDAHDEATIIPQVNIFDLLTKFDGILESHSQIDGLGIVRKYKIEMFPDILVLNVRRFVKKFDEEEKNPTIVNFPLKAFDLSKYADVDVGDSLQYDLVASISHVGNVKSRQFSAFLLDRAYDLWYAIEDLKVIEVKQQYISIADSMMLFYERVLR